jgi:hypothetical protein
MLPAVKTEWMPTAGRAREEVAMGRRVKGAALLAAGLVTAAVPVFGWVKPAAAAVNQDIKYQALTFVTYGGDTVTCRGRVTGYHDPGAKNAEVVVTIDQATGTGSFDACFNNVFLDATMTYKDEDGDPHSVRGRAYDYLVVDANHAATAVRATASAEFFACNPQASATCVLSATVAPK